MTINRMPLTRRNFIGGSAALGAAAAAGSMPAWSQNTSILRTRRGAPVANFDPGYAAFDDGDDMWCLFPSLVSTKPTYEPGQDWEWELGIAASVEQVDKTHVKFTLKPGFMWTNGYGEITAEDVKYSYERIADPANEMPYQSDWGSLARVEVIDKYNGVIVQKEPVYGLWTIVLPFGRALIVCKAATEAVGGTFTTDPPATGGPYIIKEWIPKQRLVLARNPGWIGPRPDFDEVERIQIDDDKTAELAFEAGEIDFTKIALSSVPRYQQNPPEGAIVDARPVLAVEWVGMNVDHPPFDDIRVRRAVQLSVDVETVLESVYYGMAGRGSGPVAPGLTGYRGYNLYPDRDLAEAKRLLSEAGFPNGFKTTLTCLGDTDKLTMAQVIQSNLAEVGINAEINALESGSFWSVGMEDEGDAWKDVAIILNGWGVGADAYEAVRWHETSQVGVWNWERFSDEEYDRLSNDSRTEFDTDKRHEIFVRMQDIMEESGAYLFLTSGVWVNLYRNTIRPATTPDGRKPFFHHFKMA